MVNFPQFQGALRALSKIILIPLILSSLWYLLGQQITPRSKPDLQPLTEETKVKSDESDPSMAWRSSGSTNAALIANLASNGLINSDRVKEAMLKVDRGHYCPYAPYQDSPQRIGWDATISAPHMHASAAESLLPFLHPNARVLDVGSGSGYLTHVLSNLLGSEGKVVGIDHIQGLVDLSNKNMAKSEEGKQLLESGKVKFIVGDGRRGWKEGGPYDAIHVGAAAKEAHQDIIDQLKAPGRLFIPVGGSGMQYIYVIDKAEDGTVKKKKEYGVQYVPLTDFDPAVTE